MKCQQSGCSNDAVWVQLTIFGEERPDEEPYCRSCMQKLGGTYKDVTAMTESVTGSAQENGTGVTVGI